MRSHFDQHRQKEELNMSEKRKSIPAVVVGIDGSDGAKEAFHWALAEARLRKAPLRVVHAWTYGFTGGPMGGYAYQSDFANAANIKQLQDGAGKLLDDWIGEVADEIKGIEIERVVIQDSAAAALVGAVTASDLLVVGSRGHGDFAGLLLGSVSQQCVHHAPCPVVIVHPSKANARHEALANIAHTESLATV
jgi:nucleotide-binding universal stress UspA family protein